MEAGDTGGCWVGGRSAEGADDVSPLHAAQQMPGQTDGLVGVRSEEVADSWGWALGSEEDGCQQDPGGHLATAQQRIVGQ